MIPVLTPEQMHDRDRATIESGTSVETLVDRAGHAVAWAARLMLGGCYGKRASVVCGQGNNGSDGLVAARVLREWGVRVDVFELARGCDHAALDKAWSRADLVIDAMYGTGFRGALEGDAAKVAARTVARGARREGPRVLAIDIPSGVDGNTGHSAGEAVHADVTVAFAALKPGLCFEPGRSLAGRVQVADIGIDPGQTSIGLTEGSDVAPLLVERTPGAHKWNAALLVVGGSRGMTGAPMLASRSALRAGAGVVWCCVPGTEAAASASGSEVITKALPATREGALADRRLDLGSLERFRAAVVGPGLGTDTATLAAVRRLVAQLPLPLVLDADGLTAFADRLAILASRPAPTVLTPHEGEYARLLGEPPGEDRVGAARRLAAVSGCVVLLKGPGTVVAEPNGAVAINPTGGAELATAGSGDVLSGVLGAFLARGLPAFEAALAAAFVHGRAGEAAGHTGLVAGDLVVALPDVLERF